MKKKSHISTLRALAGEGKYHTHKLLKAGKTLFLFAKYLRTTIAYGIGVGRSATTPAVAFVKGPNQLRHHHYIESLRLGKIGPVEVFTDSRTEDSLANLLPRMPLGGILKQISYLILLLLTGRPRYLNLYYLAFYASIKKVVDIGLKGVSTFVCYNDQPYDVTALIVALRERRGCRTIVVQHGLILNPNFYFPTHAQEFWAWGELSTKHFRSKTKDAKLIVTGRYLEDINSKKDSFVPIKHDQQINILLALSFFHNEVKDVVTRLQALLVSASMSSVRFSIKLHPATKFPEILRQWITRHASWLEEEFGFIEDLAEQYDALVTLNSTSAVDFLLRGKPVFFVSPREDGNFPSGHYGLALDKLMTLSSDGVQALKEHNAARLNFLNEALNV